jgi:hypothetical protein
VVLREQLKKEGRILFKSVFGSVDGQVVLAVMLEDMGFFDEMVTPERLVLRNYATRLLGDVGWGVDGDELKIVQRLLQQTERPIDEKMIRKTAWWKIKNLFGKD